MTRPASAVSASVVNCFCSDGLMVAPCAGRAATQMSMTAASVVIFFNIFGVPKLPFGKEFSRSRSVVRK
jgi:hypothetical protein